MNAHNTHFPSALPDAFEAEQALLGAILMRNGTMDAVPATFSAEHFSEPLHRAIYAAAEALFKEGKPFTTITIKNRVPEASVGGMTVSQYLGVLVGGAVGMAMGPDWCAAITAAAARREIQSLSEDLRAIAFADELRIPDEITSIRQQLSQLTQ